jgi:hypothetical protein
MKSSFAFAALIATSLSSTACTRLNPNACANHAADWCGPGMYCLEVGEGSLCTAVADAGADSKDASDAASPDGSDGRGDVTAAPGCGDGVTTPPEECDLGKGLNTGAYGGCTATCTRAERCGDGTRNGPEVCDNGRTGATDLGACNPECSGYYEKKVIKPTSGHYSTNLGGPAGADAICVSEFGNGWKALLVGGGRRATLTPFKGDASQDWVIHKYTHYYNASSQLLWRTDDVPLLGVHDGKRESIYADAFVAAGSYPWTGWANDWTTVPDDLDGGTCVGWTNATTGQASFAFADLRFGANEGCGSESFILCAQQ